MFKLGIFLLFIISSIYGLTFIDTVQETGPIRYFPMNEPNGTIAYDSSGNGDNGTYVNCIPNQAGYNTPAVYLNGTNAYVNSYSTTFNTIFNRDEGSLMIWFKSPVGGSWLGGGTGGVKVIARITYDGSNYLQVAATNTGFYVNASRKNIIKRDSVNVAWLDTIGIRYNWFCNIITWSKSSNKLKVYLNGAVLDSVESYDGWDTGNLTSTGTRVGSFEGIYFMAGWMQHYAVWNKALSKGAIDSLSRVKNPSLLCIGNSITEGSVASRPALRYVNRLAKYIKAIVFYNKGISATVLQNTPSTLNADNPMVNNGRDRFMTDCYAYEPTVFVCQYGLNDMAHTDSRFSVDSFIIDYSYIIDSMKSVTDRHNIIIGDITINNAYGENGPWWSGGTLLKHMLWNDEIELLALRKGIKFSTIWSNMNSSGGVSTLLYTDKAHPVDSGHAIMALTHANTYNNSVLITTQLVGTIIIPEDSVKLFVRAFGDNLNYRWYIDGDSTGLPNNDSLAIKVGSLYDTIYIKCKVYNSLDTALSDSVGIIISEPSYSTKVLGRKTNHLKMYLRLSETSGTIAYDISGNNNHGKYVNCILNQSGITTGDTSIYLNGVNAYISLIDSIKTELKTGSGTVSFLYKNTNWRSPTSKVFFTMYNDSTEIVMGHYAAPYSGVLFRYRLNDPYWSYFKDSWNDSVFVNNKWNHIAVTWNQSGNYRYCIFYVNGVKITASNVFTNDWISDLSTFDIGRYIPANNVEGYIGEIAVWDTCLSVDDIQQLAFTTKKLDDTVFVALSDSWGEGYWATNDTLNFVEKVGRRLGVKTVNSSMGSSMLQTSWKSAWFKSGYERYYEDVLVYKPDYLLLLLGGNDMFDCSTSVTTTNFYIQYKELIQNVKAEFPNCKIAIGDYWMFQNAPYHLCYTDQKRIAYSNTIKQLATEENLNFANNYQAIIDNDTNTLFATDKIHLNNAGHAVLADEIYKALLGDVVVNSVSPVIGRPSSQFTIQGTGFSITDSLFFNSVYISSISSTTTSITANVPAWMPRGYYNVTVKSLTGSISSLAHGFRVKIPSIGVN